MTKAAKAWTWVLTILIIGLAAFVYFRFFFVYARGINEGDINYFQEEGFIFKTWEGKMIQTGYNSKNNNATIQSNEFKFSVDDDHIAEQINSAPSNKMKLHWKRYFGTLPWRGNSIYVVDSILPVSVKEANIPIDDDVITLPQ